MRTRWTWHAHKRVVHQRNFLPPHVVYIGCMYWLSPKEVPSDSVPLKLECHKAKRVGELYHRGFWTKSDWRLVGTVHELHREGTKLRRAERTRYTKYRIVLLSSIIALAKSNIWGRTTNQPTTVPVGTRHKPTTVLVKVSVCVREHKREMKQIIIY